MRLSFLIKTFLLGICILLSGCAKHYQVNSNLDPQNIQQYFKTSSVQEMTNQQLRLYNYKVISTIEGNSCQEKANQPPATIADAKVDALRKAADAKANAIVFSTCTTFPADNVCFSSISCYAKAIKLLGKLQ
ncbi:MAG: Outer membrane lipoprotein RcsF [Candidatus Celerinatantimonas neptuna]|nr:MAG: Outer membrane lipoprotein RcsF [Candidatus Celerinatantimonas neptuna]